MVSLQFFSKMFFIYSPVVLYPFLSPSLPPRFCDLMCIRVFVAYAHRSHMKKEYNKIFYLNHFLIQTRPCEQGNWDT